MEHLPLSTMIRAQEALRALSPRLSGILQEIEIPISLWGYSQRQVATKLGVPMSVVIACRAELHNHIKDQASASASGSGSSPDSSNEDVREQGFTPFPPGTEADGPDLEELMVA